MTEMPGVHAVQTIWSVMHHMQQQVLPGVLGSWDMQRIISPCSAWIMNMVSSSVVLQPLGTQNRQLQHSVWRHQDTNALLAAVTSVDHGRLCEIVWSYGRMSLC
jgi:citrate lyase gamma subunit